MPLKLNLKPLLSKQFFYIKQINTHAESEPAVSGLSSQVLHLYIGLIERAARLQEN